MSYDPNEPIEQFEGKSAHGIGGVHHALINPSTGDPITDAELKSVSQLAEMLASSERQVADLEEALKTAKEREFRLRMVMLPEAMQKIGLGELKLTDGTKVKVTQFITASISEEQPELKRRALQWLRDNDCASIIKSEVKVAFSKGEDAKAKLAIEKLRELGLSPVQAEQVHAMTLKAFVKERVELALPLDREALRVYVGTKAIVERP